MISSEFIEEIKHRCDIAEVIGSCVTLRRAGSNLNGLCPFHSEHTPSFTVFPATRSFYCFGCGAGGDVITFVMKRENVDYRSALEILAKRAGISIPAETNRSSDAGRVTRERILTMNREAARFFHACLYDEKIGGQALAYLKERGLTGSVIRHFGLGYAPDSFSSLYPFLQQRGYLEEEIHAAYLCGISQKSKKPFDLFRNRVIFPIIDVTGNVVAFGGRVMDDSIPKYLNTSDTSAFKKSRNLFALNYAKGKCTEQLILCEGYMDVIALHANGFENAVATLGTAITSEQARIMARYTKQVVISYDADEAGQKAANKAMKLLSEVGLDVRVLRIPGAKDPDEFMKKNGKVAPEKFRRLLEQSRTQFEFKLENVLARHDVTLVDERVKAAAELCRMISEVYSEAEREVYIGAVSQRLDIPRDSLQADVKRAIRAREKNEKKEEMQGIINQTSGYGDRVNPDMAKSTAAVNAEEHILGMLLLYPEHLEAVKRGKISLSEKDFFSDFNRRVFREALACCDEDGGFDISALNQTFNPDEMGRIIYMTVRRRSLSDNSAELLCDMIARLRNEVRQKQLEGDQLAQIADILARKRKKADHDEIGKGSI